VRVSLSGAWCCWSEFISGCDAALARRRDDRVEEPLELHTQVPTFLVLVAAMFRNLKR